MVNRPGIFDAQLARHDIPLPPRRICVKSKGRPLYESALSLHLQDTVENANQKTTNQSTDESSNYTPLVPGRV